MTVENEEPLILCVEDEDALRRDIVEELEEAGYRVLQAADGDAAVTLLANNAPDLVICDISMPGLDGFGVLNTLRTDRPDRAEIPFVFLTALADPREVVEGKLLGADDYLVKPVEYDLMLATIAARLRQVARIRSHHANELATLRIALSGLSGGGAELALDLAAVGSVLLDGSGKMLHANRAAHEMATEANGIHIHADGIEIIDAMSGRALSRAISETLSATKTNQDKTIGVLLHHPDTADRISAVVCALPVRTASAGSPALVVFLSTTDRQNRVSRKLLMDLFDLTPTEALVANHLVDGCRLADIALKLDVTQTTIAFHMRNLFQKTDTNRQVDLVALILAGPMVMKQQ
jgi:DNA-binding NarL/FixJ family response regulator